LEDTTTTTASPVRVARGFLPSVRPSVRPSWRVGGLGRGRGLRSEHGRPPSLRQARAPPAAAYIARARPLHSHKRNAQPPPPPRSLTPSQRKAGCTRNPAPLLSELPPSSAPSPSTFAPSWRSPRHPRPPQPLAASSSLPFLADRLASSSLCSSVDQVRSD
jgi:hypothetical protein